MGTNYFLHSPACPHCGKEDEPLHLGKSSGGWCFGLHVYPEKGLNNWQDIWGMLHASIEEKDYEIKNEYGDIVQLAEFFTIVWDRKALRAKPLDSELDRKWLETNHAIPGSFGLARHALYPGHCIGHGKGPFDYIIGEFS